MFKKVILNIVLVIIAVYFIFGILLFLNQKSMLYYPNNQNFDNCIGFNEYEKINYKGTRFYFKQNSQNILVYYHGNAGSACDRSYLKSIFEESNYSLIFVEYAGYSADGKSPSKESIQNDVRNVNDFLIDKSFNNITILGESVGSGAASYHASFGDVDNLILITTFSSLQEVAQSKYIIYPASVLLTEKYDNIEYLKDFNGRILVIHGDNDKVIPHKFSKILFNSLSSKQKEYVLIHGYGHNDIWGSDITIEKVSQFLNVARN